MRAIRLNSGGVCSRTNKLAVTILLNSAALVPTRMVQLPATAAIEYVAAVDACLIYIISSV